MPELPEVETVRTGLSAVMTGRRVARVRQNRPDLRFPFPDGFVQRLTGATITEVGRRAKYIVIGLDRPDALIIHLGMSGRLSVRLPADHGATLGSYVYDHDANPKHDHAVFELDDGTTVTFNDPRRFGYMDLIDAHDPASSKHFSAMGPEPLEAGFSVASLSASLKGRKGPIKALLLDQRVVAGLGNIYVCEALFRAGISPLRPGGAVSPAQVRRLVPAIKAVLVEAIAYGGSTLRDFAGTDGVQGGMQERFDVYGREGEPCQWRSAQGSPRSGMVERVVQSGRSTFWCPQRQR